ncbi:PHB depolymerase family esterase [Longimicrobium sp.]|uniref:extracellular catalytic domain type 1 short-chain-length polyhydroxyalkanoate depolymerase n=1 Tax=Longimicrobium sp. TaxID=2029185 RepID=UPI002E302240|nr:PHB depolymerase family esterase [Longimicrobium sp.]HEX6039570.1 PHB depolymerase family esterase [Longimicrobium sp.]
MNRITRTLHTLTMASTLAAGACAPTGAAPAPADGPAPGASAPAAWEWHTFTGPVGTRRYRLYVPAGYDASRPAPLVVMLHGCTQDPDDFARGTRFNEHAQRAGALVAYPEQLAEHNPQKCWTWFDRAHQAADAGEPALIAGITREVMASHAVDPSRVYIGGVSAGGAMAVNTAAAYPQLFAAVGVHSGIPWRAAGDVATALGVMRNGPARDAALTDSARALLRASGRESIPMIVFHGAADVVVVPENGRRLASQWAVAAGARDFLRGDSTEGGLGYTRDRYGPLAELWMVEGLGHAWSGGSAEGTYTDARGPDASREMMRFFLEHTRP